MSPMPDFEEDDDETRIPVNNQQTDDIKIPDIDAQKDNDTTNSISPESEALNNINNDLDSAIKDFEKSDTEKIEIDPVIDIGERDEKNTLQRDSSMDTIADTNAQSNINSLTNINVENCAIPLSLFTKGYMCLPYLSLPYIDLLGDVNVRGYIVGATNVLFKQKKQLADVLVEIEGTRIESQDPDLRRQLHLTTEDLRFADFIVKHVSEERHDVFLDGVGWEGGDEWIRAQFRVYLLCLLRTSLLQGT